MICEWHIDAKTLEKNPRLGCHFIIEQIDENNFIKTNTVRKLSYYPVILSFNRKQTIPNNVFALTQTLSTKSIFYYEELQVCHKPKSIKTGQEKIVSHWTFDSATCISAASSKLTKGLAANLIMAQEGCRATLPMATRSPM